jgi:thiol-disulfide isomerase/thioredoxin
MVGRSDIIRCVMKLKVFETLSLFFLIVLFFLLCSGIVHGGLAPEFTLTDIDGSAFSLSDFRGKVVMIEFFSTTCGYCINEIPHLKAVHSEFGEGELAMISISKSYNNNTQLINFRNEYEIPWIIAKDTANVFQTYNVSSIPTLYLIDHEGVTAYHHQGVVEASTLIAKVNELLTARAAPPVISVVFPENKTYSVSVVPLTFTVNELTSWIGYSLDGQANTTITGNTTLTSLLDGSHYVVVYANDTLGNMGASSTIYFAVDKTPPNITDVVQFPLSDNVLPEDQVKVNSTITDNLSGVKKAILNYTNGNGTWIAINMTNLEGNVWEGTISAFDYSTYVNYTIAAEDEVGNAITTEEAYGYQYQYRVVPEFTPLILGIFIIATLLAVIIHRKNMPYARTL